MANTVLLRIDDRLLHGQIGRAWVPACNGNTIIIANDDIKDNTDKQKLMELVTPIGCTTHFLGLSEITNTLADFDDEKDVIILVESPEHALKLIQNGLEVDSVNIGNMRNTGYKRQINDTVFVDEDDLKYLEQIKKAGKTLDIRAIPSDKTTSEEELFN